MGDREPRAHTGDGPPAGEVVTWAGGGGSVVPRIITRLRTAHSSRDSPSKRDPVAGIHQQSIMFTSGQKGNDLPCIQSKKLKLDDVD